MTLLRTSRPLAQLARNATLSPPSRSAAPHGASVRLRNRLGPRLRDERRIALEIFGRDDAVARAAQKQRGNVHPVEPMLELGIVRVRLPGQQRQRLAVAGDDVK